MIPCTLRSCLACAGFLVDQFGRRPTIIANAAIFVTGAAILASSQSYIQLVTIAKLIYGHSSAYTVCSCHIDFFLVKIIGSHLTKLRNRFQTPLIPEHFDNQIPLIYFMICLSEALILIDNFRWPFKVDRLEKYYLCRKLTLIDHFTLSIMMLSQYTSISLNFIL